MEKLQTFSDNLKGLRKKLGLKQGEILDIKPSTWGNYEKGTSTPYLIEFVKICKYFGIRETEMLHNTHLIEDIEEGKIKLKTTPKDTPNYTPNEQVYLQFNEEQGLYMAKSDANIVLTHLRDTMKTKDSLISALERENKMLRDKLKECESKL